MATAVPASAPPVPPAPTLALGRGCELLPAASDARRRTVRRRVGGALLWARAVGRVAASGGRLQLIALPLQLTDLGAQARHFFAQLVERLARGVALDPGVLR